MIPAGQVTDGLVFYLDANDYAGTGDWTDPITSNAFSPVGSPTHGTDTAGGRYMDFTAGTGFAKSGFSGDISINNTTSARTAEVILRPRNSDYSNFFGAWGSGNFSFLLSGQTSSGQSLAIPLENFSTGAHSYAGGTTGTGTDYYHLFVRTVSATEGYLNVGSNEYANSNNIGPQAYPGNIISPNGKTVRIGTGNGGGCINAYIAVIRIYDKALSDAEVTQQLDYWSAQGLYTGL